MFINSKKEIISRNKEEERQIKVYIVWGPPAGGKSTYVMKNMIVGDLVVDLDLIKQSISLQGKTMAPNNLLDTALEIRDLLYELIAERNIDCDNNKMII